MPVGDVMTIATVSPITLDVEPVWNALHSLLLLYRAEATSGFGPWVLETLGEMTVEERKNHEMVMIGFHYALMPERHWNSFPAYMDHLASMPAEALRDKMIAAYVKLFEGCPENNGKTPAYDAVTALSSPEAYLGFLRERFPGDGCR